MTFDQTIQQHAARVQAELSAQDEAWESGWTRRRFLAGVGLAGVAALGTQLVTTRAAFGASTSNTLLVIFLRGGADGLRIVQPNNSALGLDYLRAVRNPLVLGSGNTIDAGAGWALNSALQPLQPLLSTGELAFVPATSTADASRSHFQAQALLERGGAATATDGWLNRVLHQLGPGTTFRAVNEGGPLPIALAGSERTLALGALSDFTFPGWDGIRTESERAVRTLYRGVKGPLGVDVPDALSALGTAKKAARFVKPANGAVYPDGDFANALKNVAGMLRAEVGLQVATIDAGGWDTHTDQLSDLDRNLGAAASALSAFMTDLGRTRRSRVTVAVMTEFGRRVAMNASGGTDHGHGSVLWLIGGGLARSGVHGRWRRLESTALDQGDVPGLNSPFDVLGEVVNRRLGVGAGRLSQVFPGHRYHAPGLMA
jgi:uncharacterized protein (DUF1501 family)